MVLLFVYMMVVLATINSPTVPCVHRDGIEYIWYVHADMLVVFTSGMYRHVFVLGFCLF